jgi:elongation factor 2
MAKESMIEKVKRIINKQEQIRNMSIVAHIDHGKTTLSDSLLAGAGMLSYETAGGQRYLDFLEEEQRRGITIQASNVNMVHEYEGKEYLINLIDTPGHVDFGGDVTRAVRAVDGAMVVVCAVEGAMPQTETVLRQALREKVKPILFINKVDRLINELKLTPEKIQERFIKTIDAVNKIIVNYAPKEFLKDWQIRVEEGNVCFGSSVDKWALSFPIMKKNGLTFKDIYDAYALNEPERTEALKKLMEKAPLHEGVLDMVAKHLPDPIEAQKYRIPKIWKGDPNSEEGKSLVGCDPKGPMIFCATKVVVDPLAGEITVGRLFSGTARRGEEIFLSLAQVQGRIQQIYVYKGPQKFPVDEVPAGNIIGIAGIKGASSGETVSSKKDIKPFEEIKHIFEPVVTKAIEAKNPKDLPRLIQVLNNLTKEDPTLRAKINLETGEHLLSGLGELHLEIVEHKIERDWGVPIVTSPPIVVYRESVVGKSGEVEGKSPNKHNKFYMSISPLEDSIYNAIVSGDIPEGRIKKKDLELIQKFVDAGMDKEEARRVMDVFEDSMLLDMTKGIVQIGEVLEMVSASFREVAKEGPIAREPMSKVKLMLHDAKLHEDAIHRGPAQVIPAVRESIKGAVQEAGPRILEPVQTIRIDSPIVYMGSISKIIQGRRGQLVDMQQEREHLVIIAKLPVAESFGFTSELRSATEGRGVWSLMESEFVPLPKELEQEVVKKIRQRKGLKEGQ